MKSKSTETLACCYFIKKNKTVSDLILNLPNDLKKGDYIRIEPYYESLSDVASYFEFRLKKKKDIIKIKQMVEDILLNEAVKGYWYYRNIGFKTKVFIIYLNNDLYSDYGLERGNRND